jgi:hypothetical protein
VRTTPAQTSIPSNPYPPSTPGFAPNNNALAPNTRAPNDRPVKDDGTYPYAKTPFPSAAGATGASTAGVSIGAPPDNDENGMHAEPKTQTVAIGNTGTQVFGGYFSEEFLPELRGRHGAKIWDEVRRREAQVSLLLNAIMNPIKSANWDIEPYKEGDADFDKHTEFCKFNLFEKIDWNTFKHEALTFMIFGFALFEKVHDVVFDDPKFGTYNGLSQLGFRSQKTIENWQLEQKTGKLIGVNQYTYSDLGGNQFLPGEFLVVFTHSKEGDNYEGISVLRPVYGAYKRKELYLKLAAIGVERYAIGTPIGTVPKGKEKTKEFEEFKNILSAYTSHESSFIVKPDGWNIEIQKGDFDADKIKELLVFENTEMVNALVANFLILGMNGSGGAYALGSNLGEFFTSGIQSYADLICDGINRHIIPDLIKLNFGPQRGYPKMKVSGISDKAGKELAEVVKLLTDARAIDPDMPLKEWIRKIYKMPKPDLDSAVALPAVPAGGTANFPKPNDPQIDPKTGKLEQFNVSQLDGDPNNDKVKMAEKLASIQLADKKYVAQFDKNKDALKKLMKSQLALIYSGLKDALKTKYNSLKGTDKILAAKNVSAPGLVNYKALLRDQLAKSAAQAIQQAKARIPKRIKFCEELDTLQFDDVYDALPPYVRKLIDAQASLVADTQSQDLEKSVFFAFTSEATTTDDIDEILDAVDSKVNPQLDDDLSAGMNVDAAAGDALGHVVQQSALSVFFDDDVFDGIESFTFTNEDPVSDICTELAGTTFAANDPQLDQYTPPLHHNCKSRLVPNFKGDSDNPDIDRGVSVSKKALDSMTLAERGHTCRPKKN